MESMANAFNFQSFNPLTIILLFLISCLFLYKWLTHSLAASAGTNLPPSPRRLPIIGNLHQLTKCPQRGLHALSLRYGDTMMLHLGVKRVLVVSSARSACHVMKTHDVAFASRASAGVFRRILYDGKDIASAPYGEYWRQIKGMSVLRLLSNSRVRSYSEVRGQEVSAMVAKIEGLLGREVDLTEVLMGLTNDVVCRVAFGRKYGEKSEFRRLLKELLVLLGGFFVGDFIPWLGWINRFSGLDRRVEKLKAEFDEFLEGVVREHEERVRDADGSAKDFVDVLLEVQRDEATGFSLERDSIKGIILDNFVAGTDSTSTVLEWTMSELIRHPKSMKALQAEIRQIIGPDLRFITEEALDKMKYLKATIKESMRLHPPFPLLIPHLSIKGVELNGYTIPEGTQVIVNVWAIQRDSTLWGPDPDEFRPERFLDSSVDFKGQDFELIPFGAGRRGCPGISFAMASIELALASLVGRFDWGLARGAEGESLDMEETVALLLYTGRILLWLFLVDLPNFFQHKNKSSMIGFLQISNSLGFFCFLF